MSDIDTDYIAKYISDCQLFSWIRLIARDFNIVKTICDILGNKYTLEVFLTETGDLRYCYRCDDSEESDHHVMGIEFTLIKDHAENIEFFVFRGGRIFLVNSANVLYCGTEKSAYMRNTANVAGLSTGLVRVRTSIRDVLAHMHNSGELIRKCHFVLNTASWKQLAKWHYLDDDDYRREFTVTEFNHDMTVATCSVSPTEEYAGFDFPLMCTSLVVKEAFKHEKLF